MVENVTHMFEFIEGTKRRRKISMTPMIDVVFLILVFFMLTSQFSKENIIALSGVASSPFNKLRVDTPRLIKIDEADIWLNDAPITVIELTAQLKPLIESPNDIILIRASEKTNIQRITEVIDVLIADNFLHIALVE